MLKDLDKRQQDPIQSSSGSAPVFNNKSHSQRWVILILVLLLLISLSIIIWQKFSVSSNEKLSALTLIEQPLTKQSLTEKSSIEQSLKSQTNAPPKNVISQAENNATKTTTSETSNNAVNQATLASESTMSASKNEVSETLPQKHTPIKTEAAIADAISDNANLKASESAEIQSSETVKEAIAVVTETKPEYQQAPIAQSTLTISRKQLTPEELASKKIAQAEQAIANKDIKKAEQLFEDVLLVVPSHKSARKQLAALWFGKQSYQAALNLLSRGLALDSQDQEFRLMKARIYLNQGQAQSALDTLKVLDNIRLIEYQSLLASTAQQLGEFSSAEKAYNILTELAPSIGRWWLGLAIAQDSQSQFSQAKINYQIALKQQDLSSETAQFAQNRILELGE